MIRVGITGQPGFVGTHLFKALGEQPDTFQRIPFEDAFFEDDAKLRAFVRQCDVIVHLAAMMRSPIEGEVYRVNMRLTNQLIDAMNAENVSPAILFSSSIQEGNGSEYACCKEDSRRLLSKWAKEHHTGFIGMLFPNLYGPNARPNSHSFIATFCYKLNHDEEPQILVDNKVQLKYVKDLMAIILGYIEEAHKECSNYTVEIKPDVEIKVSDVLEKLWAFKSGSYNLLTLSDFDKNLLETYKSYHKYVL